MKLKIYKLTDDPTILEPITTILLRKDINVLGIDPDSIDRVELILKKVVG